MKVERVVTSSGSYIEPALDQEWSNLRKLEWHAAVIEVDSGLRIGIYDPKCASRICGVWVRDFPRKYGFSVAGNSIGGFSFDTAWHFMTGLRIGYEAAKREAVTA